MPTQFAHDMTDMVEKSNVTISKKNLARIYVREAAKLANGSRGSIEAICDAFVAQTPILLEMYLTEVTTPETLRIEVEKAVAKHVADCPLKISQIHDTMRMRKSDEGSTDWKRLGITAFQNLGWPGAVAMMAWAAYRIVALFLGK